MRLTDRIRAQNSYRTLMAGAWFAEEYSLFAAAMCSLSICENVCNAPAELLWAKECETQHRQSCRQLCFTVIAKAKYRPMPEDTHVLPSHFLTNTLHFQDSTSLAVSLMREGRDSGFHSAHWTCLRRNGPGNIIHLLTATGVDSVLI